MEERGRQLPHDFEAERSVLGAMVLDKEALHIGLARIDADDFYMQAYADVFRAISRLSAENVPIDTVTLANTLRKEGLLDAVGGIPALIELSESVALTSNVEAYCEIVKEKSTLRRLIRASETTARHAFEAAEPVMDILEIAEKGIFEITSQNHNKGLIPIRESLTDTLGRIEELSKFDNQLTGLTTGYMDLDRMLSGMQKSDFLLLAARPSMGKTALGLNIAFHAALRDKAKVAIFSLEMSANQLNQRMISFVSGVELSKIISGQIESADEWLKVADAVALAGQLDLYIDDTPGISLTEMRSKCRRMQMEHGLDLIVIDYLQLMTVQSRSENRQQEISQISRGLKALAKEMNCPVLSLGQLSRAPEQRTDHRPIMSDLRESGAIEQDADVILMLYRDEQYNEDTEDRGIAEVLITKHRNGPTGRVRLYFQHECTRFHTIAPGPGQ